jgi:hypothetical protein
MVQFGSDAKSVLEVGCANDPFLKHIDWIDHRRCVAPYFVNYDGKNDGKKSKDSSSSNSALQFTMADFNTWEPDRKYDLLVCSQVAEHVPDPGAFVKKLVSTARTSIISVPYMWPKVGKKANHLTDFIDLDMVLNWTKPLKPVLSAIVEEDGGRPRLITVFVQP